MHHIEKALELKNELDSYRPLSKEDESRIFQKFKLDWNYHSNHLEGNTLTYGETKALILYGITAQGKPLRDHFEISGHNEAILWIMDIIHQNRPLTEGFIRELHTLILKESYSVNAVTPDGKPTSKKIAIGEYKSMPNHVETETGEIVRFASPEETPAKMRELVDWYRSIIDKNTFNPILVAAEFHYRFIKIHPFDDGNGRTARILMNFILIQNGYPPVIIKTDDKENYFSALRQADAGLITEFIDYIAKNLINSLEIMIRGAQGENIDEPDDIEKEIFLLEQRLKTISKSAEVTKNTEALINIYKNSVSDLYTKFISKCSLFNKLYVSNNIKLYIDNVEHPFSQKDFLAFQPEAHINEKIFSLKITFSHLTFKQRGFDEFNHHSSIVFDFKTTHYKVSNEYNSYDLYTKFEKLYNEQLSQNEINTLINNGLKKHKSFIEQELERYKESSTKNKP